MKSDNKHVVVDSSRTNVLVARPDRISFYLILTVFSAFWGAVEFGWNTGVINNPKSSIIVMINESTAITFKRQLSNYELDLVWSTVVAIFAIGGMIGALSGGVWSEKLGRKWGLIINCASGILAAILMALSQLANSFIMLIIGRFLVGFCSAICTCIVPVYITEVAHPGIRGGIGVFNQLGVVTGLLLAQILSIDEVLGSVNLWPYLMALAAVPCLIQIALLPLCPESPRHLLITKQKEEEARAVLVKLRGHQDVEDEMMEMQQEHLRASSKPAIRFLDLFKMRKFVVPLLVGLVLHLSQQFSGINVIFYYSAELFKQAGTADNVAKYSTIAVGAIMVVMTGVSIPLMDRAGRRTLHLIGLLGITICSISFTIFFTIQTNVKDAPSALVYISITMALLIVVFFAIGPGSIPWMMMSEMFAQEARSTANSIGVLVNWLANFIVGLIFPVLSTHLSTCLFLPFSVLTLLFLIILFFVMPETKNKTIEEITASFVKDSKLLPIQVEPLVDGAAESVHILSGTKENNGKYTSNNDIETAQL